MSIQRGIQDAFLQDAFKAWQRLRLNGEATDQGALPDPSSASTVNGSPGFNFPNPADRLPDFSFAGYRAGNAGLPATDSLRVVATLRPSINASEDRTSDLQAALDGAGQAGGGVVALEAGIYALSSAASLEFNFDNVVLRGNTSSFPSTTRLICSGPLRNTVQLGSSTARALAKPQRGKSRIVDAYVPLGATAVTVEPGHRFRVGQTVSIQRKVTEQWVAAMGMDKLVRGDPPKPQTWLKVGTTVEQQREILAIEDNTLRFEVPLTDALDARYTGDTAQVVVVEPPKRIRESGIESVTFEQHPSTAGVQVSANLLLPLAFGAAEDCWARHIYIIGFTEFAKTMRSSRRITISDFTVHRDQPTSNGGKGALPLDITLEGTQCFLLRGRTLGKQNTHSYVVSTGSQDHGPNVVSGYQAVGSTRHTIEPHQRWATGLLVEASFAGQIKMGNRRNMGSGHGWSMGAGVVWGCEASRFIVESPPASSYNYLVPPAQAMPSSLYAAQLRARLGSDARVAEIIGEVRPVRPVDWDCVAKNK